MPTQEQVAESRKAALDQLFGVTQKIVEGIAQLAEHQGTGLAAGDQIG